MKNFNFNKAYISAILYLNQIDYQNKYPLKKITYTEILKIFKIEDFAYKTEIQIEILRFTNYDYYNNYEEKSVLRFINTNPKSNNRIIRFPLNEVVSLQSYQEFYRQYQIL